MKDLNVQSQKGLAAVFGAKEINEEYLIPPQELIILVGSKTPNDYIQTSKEFFEYFLTYADLKPNANVLDIGCGCGRMAVPLTKYLTTGKYDGFDISKEAVDWCEKNIASKRKNFEFKFANLYNGYSNPTGKLKSLDFIFPYPDNSFDFVFLTSVFTHMMPEDMEHYVSEIYRVLKENGKVMVTHFLMNKESSNCIEKNPNTFSMIHKVGSYYTIKNVAHESFMAFNEDYIMGMYARYGLSVLSLNYGGWCERTKFLSYQDLLILKKSPQTL